MAADSRLTLNREDRQPDSTVVRLSVGQTDSNYKLFLTPQNIGISTCGSADIRGVPLAGFVESFIATAHSDQPDNVREVADRLLAHFMAFDPIPAIQFHVAGYDVGDGQVSQEVWYVNLTGGSVSRLNPKGEQGASWAGEADIMSRLIQPVAQLDGKGEVQQQLPYHPIPWQFFTLQDAIDFAIFAVRSTTEAIRFQTRPKSVGGPIDILVLKPTGATWIQRKALHGERAI